MDSKFSSEIKLWHVKNSIPKLLESNEFESIKKILACSSNQIKSNINTYGNTEFINFSPYNGLRYAVILIVIP